MRGRRRAKRLCVIAAWAALAGAAQGAPADASAPAPAADITSSPTAYGLEIDAPRALATLLRSYLDLARFQRAPQTEGITTAELQRLVAAAPAQARGLLETEGHFNAQVQASVEPGEPPTVRIQVQPGPRAVVRDVAIEVQDGALRNALQQGQDDAARETLEDVRRSWPLRAGEGFRQSAWASAKATTLAQLRAQGYPAAQWVRTTAQVDAPSDSVRLTLAVDSGPLFLLGAVRVEGLSRFDAASVEGVKPFEPGTPYSDKLILDYQERLRKLGLFENAVVEIDPNPATASAAPVIVRVREQTLQQATVGVGLSDRAGPRVSLEHVHRNVFGTRWVAKNKFELGRDQQSWQGELLSYPLEGGYRNLVAGNLQREVAAGTEVRSSRLRVGRTLDTEALERLVFLEALSASTRTDAHSELHSLTTNTRNRALSANVHWLRRALDNVLLPTEGESANAQLGAGYALGGGPANNGPFARAYGRLTAYRPLGSAWYGSARVEAGQVFAGSQVGIPDTLLFRAGGDESVRGYAYRSLGPTEAGIVRSARVVFSSSVEVAHPLSENLPAVWGAGFVDAGNAADHWNELDPVLGYGVGVRWRSPVGPLRVDLAYGEAVRRARLHFSLGVSF
jgi:translocation and assembly module TamA